MARIPFASRAQPPPLAPTGAAIASGTTHTATVQQVSSRTLEPEPRLHFSHALLMHENSDLSADSEIGLPPAFVTISMAVCSER